MSQSRTSNARRNMISGIANLVIARITPFIVRTILIQKLGAEYLGLNNLFVSIIQVLNMAELGFSSAITFSLYRPIAEKDDELVCAYLTYFKRIYRIIGIGVIIVGVTILPFISNLVKDGLYPSTINVHLIFLLYIMNTAFSYLFWGYKTILLSALQKVSIISNVDTVLSLLKSALQLTALLVFSNFYYFVVCILFTTVISNIVVKYITDKLYPNYRKMSELSPSQKKDVTRNVSGLAIGKVSNTARNSFDSIVLSMFYGLVTSAIYSNYYYIITSVLAIINVFTKAIEAGVGDSVAVESTLKNYADFKKMLFYFSWLGAWCTICMTSLYQPFIELWVGKDLLVNNNTMLLFVIYFYILQITQFRSVYTRACGLWWNVRHLAIGEAFCNLILNFILGYFWSVNGILLATIITVFIFSIIGVGKVTINNCFYRSEKEYFYYLIFYFSITLMISALMYLLTSAFQYNNTSLRGFIYSVVACLIIPNIIGIGLALVNTQTREYLFELKNRLIS